MPFMFNGFGTGYYGKSDAGKDGSYVTTNWFVFAGVPLIPLGSYRVVRNPNQDLNLVVYSSEGYLTQKTSLNLRQVIEMYLFILFCAAWWAGLITLAIKLPLNWQDNAYPLVFSFLAAAMLPFVMLWWKSRKERLKLKQVLNETHIRK